MSEISSQPMAISVAAEPVALIITECIAITSAMRKHARWAHSSVSAILGGGIPKSDYRVEASRLASPRDVLARRGAGNNNNGDRRSEAQIDDAVANRWGLRGKKGKTLHAYGMILPVAKVITLFSHIMRLEANICQMKDIRSFDVPTLLHPFLQVIRSSSTSAPITSLALIAITKFFAYNLIARESPRLSLAMQLLSSAITHCRFEASDSAADEIVLLRILKLMEGMLSGPGGDMLGDESVCEMMETGLSMCCQVRLSELLRRSAEISMVRMCQVIFERLKHLEIEAGDDLEALDDRTRGDMDTVKMDPTIHGNSVTSPIKGPEEILRSSLSSEKATDSLADSRQAHTDATETTTTAQAPLKDTMEAKPYSLPSIRELFRVLVDLLDPHDHQHTDAMRVMALRIIDVALEVAGPSIVKHPSLANLAKDLLCRYLFQLVRSDNMFILQESLRVAGTLLATCRSALKLQQELFLSYLVACLHPHVEIPREPGIDPTLYAGVPKVPTLVKAPPSQSGSGRSTPVPVKDRQKLGLEGGTRKPDAREAMIESIGALTRIPSFMVELYVNYDCEVDRSDLCEDMVGLLSRNAFPDSATWSTTNVPPLCLDALLRHIQFIADRLDDGCKQEFNSHREHLIKQRAQKRIIISGAAKFNEKPKAGIAYLASQGIIDDPENPTSIARFLKGTTRISKKLLGEYISKRENESLLGAFLDLFDFTGKRVDEALRSLLESFRLPGEAPLIQRIVTSFSEKYCANSTPDGVADKDAVYVLTYAIVMLNTDQHNPNVKSQNRMSYLDFARNLRGVNGGNDFAPEYLQEIYDSIKSNEIILPDEHENKVAFDYAWKELLLKTESAGDLTMEDTNIYDADVFEATWKPIIATLSYVYLSASDDAVFSRVVTGFHQCAQIASRYGLVEALDKIVYCLSSMSTLASGGSTNTALNTEIQVDKHSVMVSEMAVKFGRDFKAQLATVVLFRVVTGHEAVVREGWNHIVRIWLNLFINSLIPPFFSPQWDGLDIEPIPVHSPINVIDRGEKSNDAGVLSAISYYLSNFAADEPPAPSDEELASTLSTVDCINDCFLGDLFSNVMQMPLDSLESLTLALLAQLPEDSSPAVMLVKPELIQPGSTNGNRPILKGPMYDPSIVYVLELATIVSLRDENTIKRLGKRVAEALQRVIRDASNFHPIVVSRTVYYLLSLLKASHEHSFLRAPIILHTISSLEPSIQENFALPILQGVAICIAEAGPLRSEMANSPDFWSLLKTLRLIQVSAPIVFKILMDIMTGIPPAITANNYESALSLLNDFASSAVSVSRKEQRQDRTLRKGLNGKHSKQRENDTVARGVQAICTIYEFTGRVQALIQQSHLERNEAWAVYWLPIFRALTLQCVSPCREVRHQALISLQRSLMSPELISTDHMEWTAIFNKVLFPLIVRLLKPEVYQSDPHGMSETRVQAATLLCKIFLHYLMLLSEWEGMLDLWLKILDIMDRLMNSGQGDNLEEAVPESLKNILLVMSSGGYLVPPAENSDTQKLWVETWKRLDRFLPNLFGELFPEEVGKLPTSLPPPKSLS
ncbi:MAG: GDP/GTP exchange factor for ARF [Trizodia sp. TS-e1964]|nr:MAG: GDP/GTP exchange factor for ARF [Trizodia sp. TS-e1964]